MKKTLLLKYQKKENVQSTEFRYLLSTCILQAKKEFELETFFWTQDSADTTIPECEYVLVLGEENIYFSSITLQHMSRVLNNGASVVLPDNLASFDIVKKSQISSTRGYESLENKILKASHKSLDPNKSHLPVSLFSADLFKDLLKNSSLHEIFKNKDLLRDKELDSKVGHAGIYYQFDDYYAKSRQDILPYIPKNVAEVLEVGCGKGVTGKLIEEKLGCRVTGVELNPVVAKEAEKNISRVIVGDIQELHIEDKYDAVIATELFEHLNYPEEFLDKMKKVLNPGGSIILTTPNVGHYSILEDLAAGRWDYVPAGPLCYTHFRFFTQQTLKDFIERVGFSSYEIVPIKSKIPARFRLLKYINSEDIDLESLSTKSFYVVLNV